MEQESEQFLRKRKFLLVVPVIIFLFSAMAFWALGGGKGNPGQGKAAQAGINTSLPGANLKDVKAQDKLSLYEQIRRDSIATKAKGGSFLGGLTIDSGKHPGDKGLNLGKPVPAEVSEAKINEKLAEIRKVVSEPEKPALPVQPGASAPGMAGDGETEKLRELMQQMKSTGNATDPELKQLEGMMDKILLIQHPEKADGLAGGVDGAGSKPVVAVKDSVYKAFRAVIAGNQKVVDGASVKLSLEDSVVIHGMTLAKGQALYGLCQVTNQRVLLTIRKVRLGTSIIPVDLTVFDLDGMEGIRAKDAVTQDAMRSGAENAVQSLEFMSMDPSLATQAAGAGVETAKTLFSKKVRHIKVKLKGGYPVLLRNNQPEKH
jgi:Conjugative transposon, TraM